MHKYFSQSSFGLLLILLAGLLFFTFGTLTVVAQQYLEPSGQAPQSNVIDFINITNPLQARYGKLKINGTTNPSAVSPFVEVIGNAYIQGSTVFDTISSSDATLQVDSTGTNLVLSGTRTSNGTYTIASSTGNALSAIAEINTLYAIRGQSTAENSKSIFGQAVPPPSATLASAGIKGQSSAAGGAGVYAIQNSCDGTNLATCGFAGEFRGNLYVASPFKLFGDGRGIYKAFSIKNNDGTNSGIGVKTFELSAKDVPYATGLTADETFHSLSVFEGGRPYNPTATYAVSYDNNAKTLLVTGAGNPTWPLVVTIFYKKTLSMNILDATFAVVTQKNVQVGAAGTMSFYAQVNNGAPNNTDFTWGLFQDQAGATPCATVATCGSIVAATGNYTRPTQSFPPNYKVYLKAVWNADPTVLKIIPLNMYKISITPAPFDLGTAYYIGNLTTKSFSATVESPDGAAATTSFSINASQHYIGSSITTGGQYTVPSRIENGASWDSASGNYAETLVTTLTSTADGFAETYKAQLVPNPLDITADSLYPNASLPGQDGTDAKFQSGINQIVRLRATVGLATPRLPDVSKNSFSWSFGASSSQSPSDFVDYTMPAAIAAPFSCSHTVIATWKNPGGANTAITKTVNLCPGDATPASLSYSINPLLSSSKTFTIRGFSDKHTPYALKTAFTTDLIVNDVSSRIGLDCGELAFNWTDTSSSCNPQTASCAQLITVTYFSSDAACTQNDAKILLNGDRRYEIPLNLTTLSGAPCRCNGCAPSSCVTACGTSRKCIQWYYCDTCCAQCQSATSGTIIPPQT